MRTLFAATLILAASLADGVMVSVCGDPGMKLPPKVLLEGWNFCNRAGRACSVAPRWADCTGPDGTQRVTPSENAAGLPSGQQGQATCDSFTQQKERDLGALCADTQAVNETSFFWTAMLKSGAMNASERGLLCGLWCAHKDPDCNAAAAVDAAGGSAASALGWDDSNYVMRQPRVVQEWTVADGSGGWRGSFYGTLDQAANLTALPTPSELIEQALSPAAPGCTLAGGWLGQGDPRLAIDVAQAPGAAHFVASCSWPPSTPGLPVPWVNQSGTVDASSRVVFNVAGHVDTGHALVGQGGGGWLTWCAGPPCPGGAEAQPAMPALQLPAARSPSPHPPTSAATLAWRGRHGQAGASTAMCCAQAMT